MELIPKDFPDGKELVEEGKKLAATIEIGQNGFDLYRDGSFLEWFLNEQFSDNIIFFPQLGLKTLDEQVEGIKSLHIEFKKRDIDIGMMFVTASLLNGLPFDARERVPSGTSYVYNGVEDYKKVATAAPILVAFGDYAVGSPNSVENVVNALTAGCPALGTLSQFSWRFPYWDDDVTQIVETVKSMGIVAGKREEMVEMSSYLGDGIPSAFIDHASMVGYTLVEQYVAEKLCGAAYSMGMGGLMNNIISKCATWLAINEAGKLDEESSVIGHFEGNTIDVTEDTAFNYGLVVSDFILFAILERKYKTGAVYTPKPVTEAIRVPTVTEVVDATAACHGALKRIKEIEDANTFDDTAILELKDTLVKGGGQFFDNTMNGLSELGVDIEDPAQILFALKKLGASGLEQRFSSGKKDTSRHWGFVPIHITDKQKRYDELVENYLQDIKNQRLGDHLKGKSIIVASGDSHEFAVYVIKNVLDRLGVKIINGGKERDPEYLLHLAEELRIENIAISLHNGQCVDWVKTFIEQAETRKQTIRLFVGGVLNTMLDSSSEPVDAVSILKEYNAIPCKNVVELVRKLS